MKIDKYIIKNLNKIYKKQENLCSSYEYDNVIKMFFNDNYDYTRKNLKLFLESLIRLDPDNKFNFYLAKKSVYNVENKRIKPNVSGAYNQGTAKIDIYKHNYKNEMLNKSIDLLVKLHETEHFFHHIKTFSIMGSDRKFKTEIDKLISLDWQFVNNNYVTFEEVITRMKSFLKYFDLMQRNIIPTSRETVYAIIESAVDCYTYKYAVKDSKMLTVNTFKCDRNYVEPKFDVDFCFKHFMKEYFKHKLFLNNKQTIDFDKLKAELTELADKFDESAMKLFEIAEELFPMKYKLAFKPTKSVAYALQNLESNYGEELKNKIQPNRALDLEKVF